MKVVRLLALPAVAALPQLALAATPPGELGALQAVYDFCVKADPAHANDFQGKSAGLFEGFRQPVVVQIKGSGEYERGYNMLARVLQGLPNDQAVIGCAAITTQLTGRTHGSVVRKPVQPALAASHSAEAHQPATPVFAPAASHPAAEGAALDLGTLKEGER